MKKQIILSFLFLFLFFSYSYAEVVVLKSGQRLEGEILARTIHYIKMDVGIGVHLTYYLDKVHSIDGIYLKIEDDLFLRMEKPPEVKEVTIEDVLNFIETSASGQTAQLKKLLEANNIVSQDNIIKTALNEDIEHKKSFHFDKLNFLHEKFDQIFTIIDLDQFPMTAIVIVSFIVFILYLASCFPFVLIAKKVGAKHLWMGWIPILQIALFFKMAKISLWAIFLMLFPVVNFFMPLVLWFKIVDALKKPPWLAFLMYIPLVNLIFLWYLALSKKQEVFQDDYQYQL